MTLFVWFAAIAASAIAFLPKRVAAFQVACVLLVLALVLVCYVTGEPPAWRWGDRK